MKETEKVFKALANETRLEILSLLSEHPLCVNALASELDVSQPAVSQHLRVLENARLIKGKKMGNMVHYSLIPENFAESFAFLGRFAKDNKGVNMCKGEEKEKCHLGKDPMECTPEQIKECHGDVKEHECEKPQREEADK
ncbi:MAG: metalloregulator ArsR/SmtB family transcription factor [Candidatus Bathyarchaeota archaeon]|nr:metalloregulator ArsR/SmtB family transcription factor [Candidatus Bathyarchaeota archaeon]